MLSRLTRPLQRLSASTRISRNLSIMSLPVQSLLKETEVAILSVLRACHLTQSVQSTLKFDETVTKPDKSPVTVADLSAQSLISLHLLQHFPKDPIVGEEDTTELRANSGLRERVIGLVNGSFEQEEGWARGQKFSEDEILDAIDKGNAEGGGKGRYWTIDPVDGTSGFIRKQQYAVCLALVVDGIVQLGVIGCPNLGPEPAKLGEEIVPTGEGVLMLAVRGEGSWARPLPTASYQRLHLPSEPTASNPLTFLESVEAGHSAHDLQAKIGSLLGVTRKSLRMDSQAKYACLARGEGGVYLRIPTKYSGGKEYQEKIWDHAPGSLLIEESGGVCTDMHGKPLDFSLGRTLKGNEGIVAAGTQTHARAIEAVKAALAEL